MTNRLRIVLAIGAALAVGVGWGFESRAGGKDVMRAASSTTPIQTYAVASLIETRFPGAIVDGVDTGVELGLMVYDIDLFLDGRELSIEVAADGTLLTKQTVARLAGLPESVRDQIPAQLRERRTKVRQIEIYHDLGGQGPRTVYHLEQDDRAWLLDANGVMSITRSSTPTSSAVAVARDDSAQPAGPTITPIDTVQRGQAVVLRGEVERLRDTDEFILTDDNGSIEVYIGWQNRMPVQVGQTVMVHGVADDDTLRGFRPDIYAHQIVLPDGHIVDLPGERYD